MFVKIHTHGTQERDIDTLLGAEMDAMHTHLERAYNDGRNYVLHYVTARETYNIIKAAEAGKTGNPADYRDYHLPPPRSSRLGRAHRSEPCRNVARPAWRKRAMPGDDDERAVDSDVFACFPLVSSWLSCFGRAAFGLRRAASRR